MVDCLVVGERRAEVDWRGRVEVGQWFHDQSVVRAAAGMGHVRGKRPRTQPASRPTIDRHLSVTESDREMASSISQSAGPQDLQMCLTFPLVAERVSGRRGRWSSAGADEGPAAGAARARPQGGMLTSLVGGVVREGLVCDELAGVGRAGVSTRRSLSCSSMLR